MFFAALALHDLIADCHIGGRVYFQGLISPRHSPCSFRNSETQCPRLQVDGSFSRRPGGNAVVVIEHLFSGANWEANE